MAVASKGLQLFCDSLRTIVFWVARSVQVVKEVSADALVDEREMSDVASRAPENSRDKILRTRYTALHLSRSTFEDISRVIEL